MTWNNNMLKGDNYVVLSLKEDAIFSYLHIVHYHDDEFILVNKITIMSSLLYVLTLDLSCILFISSMCMIIIKENHHLEALHCGKLIGNVRWRL